MRTAVKLWIIFLFFAPVFSQEPTPTPEPIRENVVVIADRTNSRVGDTPASVSVISNTDLKTSASPAVDETLRQSVGFSTFRRSGSRTSNPTTQGVSFRGAGSSGASRAIVLFDGVPLNDPFGGWVQWQRVSAVAIDKIEVLRGGASTLYGDYSLSGAINIIPRKAAERNTFSAEVFAGLQDTFSGSLFGGTSVGGFTIDGTAASFQTRGFVPVEIAVRGPVDSFSGVRSNNFSTRIGREFGKTFSIFVRPSFFGEVRTNGTGLQTNRTHIRQIITGGSFVKGAAVSWRLYGGTQVYDQVFSAVNLARTTESLTRIQRVPAANFGGSFIVSGTVGDHTLVGGVDARRVSGSSDEIGYTNGVATSKSGAGGRETTFGGFVRDLVKVGSKLVFVVGIRFDRWQNEHGLVATRSLSTNLTTTNTFRNRSEIAVSPQAALLYHINNRVSLYVSGSTSFRTPTLNELYRAFRVGNINTLANADLKAERATNFEGGFSYKLRTFNLRSSAFWTDIDRAVSNVTLTTTQALITRQRQNVGQTRSAGFEIEAETTFRGLHLSAGYLFADSRVVRFNADRTLIGLRVPQVARHQLTFQAGYDIKNWTLAAQMRAAGKQFDDDQNLFRLETYLQIDVFASRKLGESISIFAAIENITNTRYSTARTPIRSVSSPINFRAGIRWK